MKKFYTLLFLMLMPLMAFADAVEINSLYYNLNASDQSAEVTSNPNKYTGDIVIPKTVTYEGVDYKVTAIGESAFYACWDIKSVIINADLVSIGNSAFWNVTVPELTLPSSLKSIGKEVFFACNSLTTLVVPEGVETIGYRAFASCNKLRKLELPSTLTSIGEYIISDSEVLSAVVSHMTDPINVGENTFTNSSATLYVPVGSKSKYEAISGWTKFNKIEEGELKETVVGDLKYSYSTDSKTATVIQDASYKELKSITIPTSITVEGVEYRVTAVGNDAFYNCYQLTSLVIPEGIETIGKKAFRYCHDLKRLELPSTLTSIGEFVIEGNSKIDLVISHMTDPINVGENTFMNSTWDNSSQTIIYIPSSATLYVPEGSKSKYEAISGWTKFAKIEEGEIKEAVVGDLKYRFSTDSKTATVIQGDYSNLQSVTIPASITVDGVDYKVIAVGNSAFLSCDNLRKVELPSTLTGIAFEAFSNCGSLAFVVSHIDDPFEIYNNVFGTSGWVGDVRPDIPATATLCVPMGTKSKYQSTSSWKDFTNIIETDLKETVIDGLIYYCLTSLNEATVIGEKSTESDLLIPVSIETDGKVFHVTKIANNAFLHNTVIETISIAEGVKTIGYSAFSYCSNLKWLEFPSTLTSIGEYVIGGNGKLESVTSYMTDPINVGENTFMYSQNTPSSATLYVPEGSKSKYEAIPGWTQFAKIEEGEAKQAKVGDLVYLYSTGSKTAIVIQDASYKELESITIPASVTIDGVDYKVIAVGESAFYSCWNIKSVTINADLETIGNSAFWNVWMSELTLPSSLKSIGGNAFYACNLLTSLVIPEGVESIGNNAFSDCYRLQYLELPSTLTSIGEYVISNSDVLSAVVSRMTDPISVGESTFMNSTWDHSTHTNVYTPSAATLYVPEGSKSKYEAIPGWTKFAKIEEGEVKEAVVDDLKYSYSTGSKTATIIQDASYKELKSITIPTSITIEGVDYKVTAVGNDAFYNCYQLTSLVIPEGIETIGKKAFGACFGLRRLELPSTLTSVGEFIIESNDKLDYVISHMTDPINVGENTFIMNRSWDEASQTYILTSSSATLYVPVGSKSKYEAISGWTQFAKIEEGEIKEAYVGDLKYSYSTGSKTATIIQDASYKELVSVIIPASVTIDGVDYKVIAVGESAFDRCNNIKSVTINANIESIGNRAFIGVPISGIALPNSLKSIGDYAFQNCSFTSLVIPEGVETIGYQAFAFCKVLNMLVLPSTLTSVGSFIINGSTSLKSVISHMIDPINVGENTFMNDYYDSSISSDYYGPSSATLYVPIGSKSKYEAISGWTKFAKIEELVEETYHSDLETPLTFEAIKGQVTVSIYNKWASASNTIEYSVDDGPWTGIYVPADYTIPTAIPAGHIVRLRSNVWYGGKADYMSIRCDADCYVYGNVMSLVKGAIFAMDYSSLECCLGRLFYNNKYIKNHPEKEIILPATTLSPSCYLEMFSGCTGLTRAPELPAMTLETSCYESMFEGCTNLAKAPDLPATTVTQKGYYKMFKGCTSITSSPSFPSTPSVNGGAQSCYSNMFEGCTSLVEGPEALGLGNKPNVYIGMFKGCTSLTSAPRLTATLVHEVSYSNMFEGCTSLKIAPELPATQLKMFCYANMFKGCTSLVEVPKILPAKGMKWDCYSGMFEGCTSLTKAPELPSTSLDDNCYTNMFSGCTSLTEAPELPAEQLVSGCYTGMFKGCSNLNYVDCKATSFVEGTTTGWLDGVASTGTFRKPLSMTTWPKGVDGIPEGWTVEDLESISVGSSGYSTYNNEGLNLDFSETEEMKAYVATGYDYDMNTIWLTRVKDVPAGMPIMVKGSINTGYDIPVEEVSVSYFVNMFVANNTGSTITLPETSGDMTNYYLSNGIFNSSTGDNPINPGKCYLQIPTVAPTHTVGSSQTVKMNGDGFASFCGSQDLDFTDVEGLKAYAATGYDDATGTIWLTRVKRVSAGTGLLLKGAPSSEYTIPSIGVRSYYANMMVGNQTNSDITIYTTSGDMTNYYLKGNKLLKADDKKGNPIYPGKAYMQIPSKHVTRGGEGGVMPEELPYRLINEPEVIPMQVLTRALGGEDDGTTDIREITQPERIDNVFYNLQGQRVDKPTRGLYIRNGKVIVIK